jgi:hypothetical protein
LKLPADRIIGQKQLSVFLYDAVKFEEIIEK